MKPKPFREQPTGRATVSGARGSQGAGAVDLSVVVPVHNEEHGIPMLMERLGSVLRDLGRSWEVIVVDDGSSDGTLRALETARAQVPALRVVELARNFGKEVAVTAGLDHTSGRAVVVMDADLQDPPELIPELLAHWEQGYEMVYATRRSRLGESWLKRATSYVFYILLNWTSDIPIPRNTGDFRLMDRRVVDALKRLPEHSRFMKGLFAWVGFRQTAIQFDRPGRSSGRTQWNYIRLWKLSIDGITSFSSMPLKLAGLMGILVSFAAFLYLSFLIVRTLIHGVEVPGYASLMVVILFLGGIQLFTLGVIGEYLGRVFEEVKNRPLYLVRQLHGFDEETP